MRRRDIPYLFRLDQEEAKAFEQRVEKSGLSREAYVRQAISGRIPREAPPPEYHAMMKELHKIGNNLNQICQKAHVLNVIDVQRYDKDMRMFETFVRQVTEAVVLPYETELPGAAGKAGKEKGGA